MAKRKFKAESGRLLDMMINSIYTHREIFLREIISNASDAVDKLCYISLTDDSVGLARGDFAIEVAIDGEKRTLTVSDNGVGMTKEDLEADLGVIASSGSFKFKQDLEGGAADAADIDIIGQFGVGFYSAFMVSDAVTVITRAHGEEQAYMWQSSGADGYTIRECGREAVGTDVIMHIKADAEDEDYSQFLSEWRVKELIKKYSDYIRWPVKLGGETVNSMTPIWQRPRSEVTDEDLNSWYRERYHDASDPARVVTINAEGAVSYRALLFIPQSAPYNFYTRGFDAGLELYSSGVMIMERCEELLPEAFRFVRGVVDSADFSLNISRELLQHDRQLKAIAANIEKKIKSELAKLMSEDFEKYEKVFGAFGTQIKYAAAGGFGTEMEKLKELLIFPSSNGGMTSLEAYQNRMPESQKYAYYISADTPERAARLPQAEPVLDAGYELLYLTQEVDEFCLRMLGSLGEKEIRSASDDDLGLEDAEKKPEDREDEPAPEGMLDFLKEALGEEVKAVRLSHRLKSHPVCLASEGPISLEMEKYFSRQQLEAEAQGVRAERVLEINPAHPAYAALKNAFENDRGRAADLARILYGQAQLIAGLPVDDPVELAALVCSLMG